MARRTMIRLLAVVCSLWLADCCYICISEDWAEMTIHHSTSTGHCTIICHGHTPETPVSLHNPARALLFSSSLLSGHFYLLELERSPEAHRVFSFIRTSVLHGHSMFHCRILYSLNLIINFLTKNYPPQSFRVL